MSEIIRMGKREHKYSAVSNEMLQDKRLTWEARGVMSYLMANDFDAIDINDLVELSRETKVYASIAINQIIKELEKAGYIAYVINGDKW